MIRCVTLRVVFGRKFRKLDLVSKLKIPSAKKLKKKLEKMEMFTQHQR